MEEEGKTGIPIATGGGETKASSSSSSGSSSYSPLSSLEALLADPQGSELFEEYLESEGLLQQLHFLFAVDGLKTTVSNSEPPQKLAQKIRSISKLLDRLVGLSETTKTQLHEDQINLPPTVNVFDKARDEIEAHMKINLLPNFLKSDIYIHNYIKLQTIIEEGSINASGPTTSEANAECTEPNVSGDVSSGRTGSKEKETTLPSFSSQGASSSGNNSGAIPAPLKLTSGALEATRRVRLDGTAPPSRLVIHHHPRKGCGSGPVLNPYHASYSSYNPVSRQDSEIQSLSSADGKIATASGFVRRFDERRSTGASSSSKIRKDNLPKDNLPKIHPTDAASVMRKEIPKFDEKEFTRQLIKKLELVVEERRREKVESKNRKGAAEELRPHAIASALRKIQCGSQVEAADDILDQHLSRIWSDKTPIRSPPRHASGQKTKKSNGSSRKKIDTYSVDSGIEFKTPGYEINPLKKVSSRQKAGTSTTQEDSGISLVSSSFTQAQHRVAEWQANLPKSSSTHHSLHHQQAPLVSSSSGPAPKKPTTPPRFTILIIYSDSPEAKETYRLSSDVTLTLGQLKQQLPRRGNFRYFFKKVCDELDIVVQEEITRDDAVLPQVAAGKIVVTLQPQPQQL